MTDHKDIRWGQLPQINPAVRVYSIGICYCSICIPKDMPIEDAVLQVNVLEPTGISSDWELSSDATFHGGEPNPVQCHDDPDRLHYLLDC
jgi:hypothetical protein